jgi:hypothetical protein
LIKTIPGLHLGVPYSLIEVLGIRGIFMNDSVDIRQMTRSDIDVVYRVFTEHDIRKPNEYIIKCLVENQTGERITLLAFYHGQFAESLHLLANSYYPHFRENGIPEINAHLLWSCTAVVR